MTLAPPMRSLDSVGDGGQQTSEGVNAALDRILDTTAHDYGHAVRSMRAKAHGILPGAISLPRGLALKVPVSRPATTRSPPTQEA